MLDIRVVDAKLFRTLDGDEFGPDGTEVLGILEVCGPEVTIG